MDEFPVEVTTEILSRLPASYVSQCRCVCKAWKKVIDDPHFASLHFTRSLESDQHSSFLLIPSDYHAIYIVEQEKDDSKPPQTSKICFSVPNPSNDMVFTYLSNGLIGFSSQQANVIYTYIYNPITRESLKLPQCSNHPKMTYIHSLGLGLDQNSNAFKMVLILYYSVGYHDPCDFRPAEARVLTLGSDDSWRNLDNLPILRCLQNSPVFFNGSLHWLTRGYNILTFDLASEDFGLIRTPIFNLANHCPPSRFFTPEWGTHRIVVLGGCLSVSVSYCDGVELWIMKDYGVQESWSKTLIMKDSIKGIPSPCVFPISIGKNGEIILFYDSTFFVSYDTGSGRSTPIQIDGVPRKPEDGKSNYIYQVHSYFGNLMPILHPRTRKIQELQGEIST